MYNFEEYLRLDYYYPKNPLEYFDDNLRQQNLFCPYSNIYDQSKNEFNDKENAIFTEENIKQVLSTNPETRWENSELSNINESNENHMFRTKNNSSNNEVKEIKNGENDSSNKKEIKENINIEHKIDLSPPDKKKRTKPKIVITPQNEENKKINDTPFISDKNQGNITKDVYSYKKIVNILKKINVSDEIIKKIKEDIIKKELEKSLGIFKTKNKRIRRKKRRNRKFKRINKNKAKKKKPIKRGRISLRDPNSKGKRNKYCTDNIIKKIKALFCSSNIEYAQIFLNKNKKNYDKEIKLLTLDHEQYIKKLEKKLDLELLDKSLKDFISLDTSKRYRKIDDKEWNKKIIQKIMEKEKDNEKINALLNMSFNDWIDIFTYKKEWEYNIKFDKLKAFIEDISENNDEEYFSKVILYLFNYKRWFINLVGRVRKKSNENQTSKK